MPAEDVLARAMAQLSRDIQARAIAVISRSGRTAQVMSAPWPAAPIVATSPDPAAGWGARVRTCSWCAGSEEIRVSPS
jgi:pyruvate kinase